MTFICVFGDSIAYGAYDLKKQGWVNRLREFLEESDDYHLIYNLGVDAEDSSGLLDRIEKECISRNPEVIIIGIGPNDSQYNSENLPKVEINDFEEGIKMIYGKAKRFTPEIIFLGIPNVDEKRTTPVSWDKSKNYSNKSLKKYGEVVEKFCKDNKVHFIKLFGTLNDGDFYDGLHPNDKGHEKIYQKVKEYLVKNKVI